MKFIRISVTASVVSCLVWCSVSADITFANKNSGFMVASNSHLNLAGATLVGGLLRSSATGGLYTSNPANAADAGTAMNVTGTTIEYVDTATSVQVDGSVRLTGNSSHFVQVGSNAASQVFMMPGGDFATNVRVVAGDAVNPTIIQGEGALNQLYVTGATYTHMRWNGPFSTDIFVDGGGGNAHVILDQELLLAPQVGFNASDAGFTTFVDGNGYRLLLGGAHISAPTLIANHQSWANASIILTGPVRLNDGRSITFTNDGSISGAGNICILGAGAFFDRAGSEVTVENCIFRQVQSNSFQSTGVNATSNSWLLSNVLFEDGNGEGSASSILVDGTIVGDNAGIFGGTTEWDVVSIALQSNCSFEATWSFTDLATINGNGLIFNMDDTTFVLDADVVLSDITLNNVWNDSFDRDSGDLLLSNVVWNSTDGDTIRITGIASSEAVAHLTLPVGGGVGNIFTNFCYWQNASVELLSDVSFHGTWIANDTMIIQGSGHVLDLSDGSLGAAANQTLYLRDVVLNNVNNDSFVDNQGVINLSNVTINLSGNVDTSEFDTYFVITGPVTFVTGGYTFTTWHGFTGDTPIGSRIDGVTVYYDTLSRLDNTNVDASDFHLLNGGRVLFVEQNTVGSETFSGSSAYVVDTDYLSVGNGSASARTLTFNYDGNTAYKGLGRSVHFPMADDVVMTIGLDTTVKTTNVVLDGLVPQHLAIEGELYFGDKTTIRLHQDWALDRSLNFGTENDEVDEVMTIDCNGFTIDMSHAAAQLNLLEYFDCYKTLRICNGRIINLSASKINIGQYSTLILENMELVLDDNFDWGNGSQTDLVIEGRCRIGGVSESQFNNTSTGDIIIAAGSTLTFADGIEYYHNTTRMVNFLFANQSSSLEFIGSSLQVATGLDVDSPLQLRAGTLIVDHIVNFYTGDSEGIEFGDNDDELFNMQIIIRPGATIHKYGTAPLLYHNID